MNATPTKAPTLKGGRSTEALDLDDTGAAFAELVQTTRDPVAAAILVAGTLISEAIREAQS